MKPGQDYIGVSVSFWCHDGDGNFLFHKRSQNCRDEQGTWDSGGGQLEFGETLEEGLFREIKEEYGCSGTIEEILPANAYIRENGDEKRHWVIIPYIVKVNRAEAKRNELEKMDDIGWFKLSALPEPLHTGVKADLIMYTSFFQKYNLPQ